MRFMDEKALTEIIEASASPPSAPEPIEVPAVTVEYGDTHTDELGTHTPVNVRCGETVVGYSYGEAMDEDQREICLRAATQAATRGERARLTKAGS